MERRQFLTPLNILGELKVLGFWEQMVARLKLEEIDGKDTTMRGGVRLNVTQHLELAKFLKALS